MSTVKISPLTKIDKGQIKRINQLIAQLFGGFNHSLSETYLDRVMKNPNSKLFAAFYDGTMVGMVLVHIYTSLSRKAAILDELVVDTQFKRQKIGREMIDAAKKWAVENNADCLECTTRVKNKPAIRFFSKLGFYDRNQKAFRLNLK